ncbi:MAG: GNAT family N-acetyltransferase [Flavobacteriaceae bacterium]
MENYIFTSKRLGFRNWNTSDKKPFFKMCNDKDVMAYFPKTLTKINSDALILRLQNHYQQHNFTFFAVDELETNQFIGFIGLINTSFKAYFTPCVEIGWRLQKESWGKGFATEGAKRCLEYGFNYLNLKKIVAITAPANKNSEQVMLKIGMKKDGEFEHPKLEDGHWLKTEMLYVINK